MKKGYCHIDGKVCTINFVEDQREFVEDLQIGKQIGKLLDMPKHPQAQEHICWGWNLKNMETWFLLLKKFLKFEKLDLPVTVMVLLKMGPMGPRGLGPNPFSTVSPCPLGVFCSAKKVSKQNRQFN